MTQPIQAIRPAESLVALAWVASVQQPQKCKQGKGYERRDEDEAETLGANLAELPALLHACAPKQPQEEERHKPEVRCGEHGAASAGPAPTRAVQVAISDAPSGGTAAILAILPLFILKKRGGAARFEDRGRAVPFPWPLVV